jgi:transcriptional regulator with XRE-family HTH domain
LRARLTQEDVAIAAGIDSSAVGHWETGRSAPGPRELDAAAAIMGQAVGDFLSTPAGRRSLAQLRQQTGHTQAELAGLLGLPVTTWGWMELGSRRIPDDRLIVVAELLAADPDDVRSAWQRTRDRRTHHAVSDEEVGEPAPGHREPRSGAANAGQAMGGSPWAPAGSSSLAELRLRAGYTQADLARPLSLTRRNWGAIELGKQPIGDDRLPAVAALLDTDPDTVRAAWQRVCDWRQHATGGGRTGQSTPITGSSMLSELRQRAGYSQAALAALLGLSRTTWGSMERGARRIDHDRLPTVAALLDTDPATIHAAWQATVDRRHQHTCRPG